MSHSSYFVNKFLSVLTMFCGCSLVLAAPHSSGKETICGAGYITLMQLIPDKQNSPKSINIKVSLKEGGFFKNNDADIYELSPRNKRLIVISGKMSESGSYQEGIDSAISILSAAFHTRTPVIITSADPDFKKCTIPIEYLHVTVCSEEDDCRADSS